MTKTVEPKNEAWMGTRGAFNPIEFFLLMIVTTSGSTRNLLCPTTSRHSGRFECVGERVRRYYAYVSLRLNGPRNDREGPRIDDSHDVSGYLAS